MAFERLRPLLHRLAGSVYIPPALRAGSGDFLLHLSDLPSSLYPLLGRICRRLEPAWILLSGDLADEIKLELNPYLLPRYCQSLSRLRKALAPSLAAGSRLVLAVGNHDEEPSLRAAFPEALVFRGFGRFLAGDLDCAISHWPRSAFDSGAEYLFYGHDRSERTRLAEGRVFLNGLESINILELGSRELHCLPYPFGTDEERLRRHKIGI